MQLLWWTIGLGSCNVWTLRVPHSSHYRTIFLSTISWTSNMAAEDSGSQHPPDYSLRCFNKLHLFWVLISKVFLSSSLLLICCEVLLAAFMQLCLPISESLFFVFCWSCLHLHSVSSRFCDSLEETESKNIHLHQWKRTCTETRAWDWTGALE